MDSFGGSCINGLSGFFGKSGDRPMMTYYEAAETYTAVSLHFVDVVERTVLAGAQLEKLTPVVGGFGGKRAAGDVCAGHTAYRIFFEQFFGIYADADFVEVLVEELRLIPEFQKMFKDRAFYVLRYRDLLRIVDYVRRSREYVPLYEKELPRSMAEVIRLRTLMMDPRIQLCDGVMAEDLARSSVGVLAHISVDEPRGIEVPLSSRRERRLLPVDPFLLDDLGEIRSWMNHKRYAFFRALTRVSRKVVRRIQTGKLRAVYALTRRRAAPSPEEQKSLALVEHYRELADEHRSTGLAGVLNFPSRKKLNRVAPWGGGTPQKRTHAPTLEIIAENGSEDGNQDEHCEGDSGPCGGGDSSGTGPGEGHPDRHHDCIGEGGPRVREGSVGSGKGETQ
jgi:hypothetical protein